MTSPLGDGHCALRVTSEIEKEMKMGSNCLPAVDFSGENLKPGSSGWIKTCSDVKKALEKYGSFMVVNYDKTKAAEVCGEALAALKEVFDLPLETKMKNKYKKPLIGYVGQIPKLPLHESMGIDNAADADADAVSAFTDLMWPIHGNPSFSEKVYRYVKLAAELDKTVTRMIFESYGTAKYHDAYVESTSYLLRLLKNRAPIGNEPHLAFLSHTDKSFTTILHQNQIDGLEMDTSDDGDKISIHFPPASFVVVAGDALMVWSNDRITAPTHRVIMNGKVDRYSMGLFGFNNGMIHVPQELVDEEHPLRYRALDHQGLFDFFRTQEGYNSECPVKAYCGI